ncbi:MAG: hypothetical protein GXY83_30625 [Rhodopirellula sp.]|nr:hypothetical protein [Rhodopirellula sp.]
MKPIGTVDHFTAVMNDDRDYLELRCPGCSWSEVCGPAAMARWLGHAGKMRPGREPPYDIIKELLRGATGQLECPQCGRMGLLLGPTRDGAAWADEPICSSCRRPISPERLEAVPGARLCAECQRADERGLSPEVEYCPRCGWPMQLRLSRSAGISRYVLQCTAIPPCRK